MLVHCFWLLEFKFVFEFTCLTPFSNCSNPFFFFPQLTLFGPIFVAAHQLKVHRYTSFSSAWFITWQPSSAAGPSGHTTPTPSPAAADKRDPLVIPFLLVVPVPDSSPSPRRARTCAFLAWRARLGPWPAYLRSSPPPEAPCHPNPSRPKPSALSPKP
jgi:hypothetical protein